MMRSILLFVLFGCGSVVADDTELKTINDRVEDNQKMECVVQLDFYRDMIYAYPYDAYYTFMYNQTLESCTKIPYR